MTKPSFRVVLNRFGGRDEHFGHTNGQFSGPFLGSTIQFSGPSVAAIPKCISKRDSTSSTDVFCHQKSARRGLSLNSVDFVGRDVKVLVDSRQDARQAWSLHRSFQGLVHHDSVVGNGGINQHTIEGH